MARKLLVFGLVWWLLAGLHGVGTARADPAQDAGGAGPKTTLTLAKVSQTPEKQIAALTALGRYLVAGLGDLGLTRERVIIARDNEHMIELLRAGEVDIVRATPFTALTLEEEAGAEIFLREWRKGVASYHTVFFTREDSPIRSLSDLAGKTIAFEDPGSTSAYFVPMLTLRYEGLSLVDLSAAGAAKSDDAVNFVFAESEVNIVGWVARGRADAGVLSNLEWVDPEKAPTSLRRNLRIFHNTPPVLRSVLLVRDGLRPDLKARLKDLLVTMHESDEGRAALAAVKAARYDELTGEAAADLEHVRNLYAEFR